MDYKYRIREYCVAEGCAPFFYIEKKIFGIWMSAHSSSHQGGNFSPTPFNSYHDAVAAINGMEQGDTSYIKYHYL